jgi:hypothetical protein
LLRVQGQVLDPAFNASQSCHHRGTVVPDDATYCDRKHSVLLHLHSRVLFLRGGVAVPGARNQWLDESYQYARRTVQMELQRQHQDDAGAAGTQQQQSQEEARQQQQQKKLWQR